jgi:hypothetical protein
LDAGRLADLRPDRGEVATNLVYSAGLIGGWGSTTSETLDDPGALWPLQLVIEPRHDLR